MRNILLLSGKINSGKDFTADILVKKENWVKISFASSLKKLASEKYGIDIKDLNTQQGKKKLYSSGETYRVLLINLARDLKNQDENVFVKKALEEIKKIGDVNIVIPDWRYPHEIEYIYKNLPSSFNVITARINRPCSFILDDPSETSLETFNFDFVIENYKDEKFLYSKISKILT